VSQSTDITFEAGYRRLQDIAERLASDEVPVHEMCDLFAEGKGLEQALGDYLAEQKERVEAIERGDGMRAFRVVPPGEAPAAAHVAAPPAAANGAAPPAAPDGAAPPAAANGAAPPAAADGAAPPPAAGAASSAPPSIRAERGGDGPPAPPQDEVLPF
jgi:exodeoxyribonuclease VII small subunit